MKPDARLRRATDCVDQCFVAKERAIGDRSIDARQVLHDRPASAKVQMTDLAVAHLAHRQPDCLARGVEPSVRPLVQQRPPMWHLCLGDSVVLWPLA